MAYPVPASAGASWTGTVPTPAYSGTFIPELWSGKIIEKFYDATVLAAVANTDYEGEITSYGDKVTIRTKPSIAINDYTAYTALTTETPSSAVVELLIDQGKYWSTALDDVMEIQSDLDHFSLWADDASEQMKIEIDTDVLAGIPAGVSANNQGATAGVQSGTSIDLGAAAAPVTVTNATAINKIIECGQILDENNIPETGRWIVIPAWLAAMIKTSDLRDASLTGDGVSMLRNGRLGMIDRFTLYASNLLPYNASDLAHSVLFGHSHGLTFASQLTKVETLRAESTFGTILRGLQVFGYKVVDGTALGILYASRV
jgi:hypothetical protein